ncbi:LOW QUALITY PROTEIN: CREB-binding protein [Plecturocebus cupreus]
MPVIPTTWEAETRELLESGRWRLQFWGTCEEHTILLHRYTRGSVICCLPPLHLYLVFLPMLSPLYSPPPTVPPLPLSLPPTVPPLFSPNIPQRIVLPSLCPCVLIVQHPPMSENMREKVHFNFVKTLLWKILGHAQWLMAVIPELWEAKAGRSPGLLWRLKQENCLNLGGRGFSELKSRSCTPSWTQEDEEGLVLISWVAEAEEVIGEQERLKKSSNGPTQFTPMSFMGQMYFEADPRYCIISLPMGITGNTSPFGQPFSQAGGQPMGATGVNPQLASKQSMVNSLPTFPTDIKNTSVTNVPNMLSNEFNIFCDELATGERGEDDSAAPPRLPLLMERIHVHESLYLSLQNGNGNNGVSCQVLAPCCMVPPFKKVVGAAHSRSQGQEIETILANTKKISQAWWHIPVVLATREAQAGQSLEPGRRRLQYSPAPHPHPLSFIHNLVTESLCSGPLCCLHCCSRRLNLPDVVHLSRAAGLEPFILGQALLCLCMDGSSLLWARCAPEDVGQHPWRYPLVLTSFSPKPHLTEVEPLLFLSACLSLSLPSPSLSFHHSLFRSIPQPLSPSLPLSLPLYLRHGKLRKRICPWELHCLPGGHCLTRTPVDFETDPQMSDGDKLNDTTDPGGYRSDWAVPTCAFVRQHDPGTVFSAPHGGNRNQRDWWEKLHYEPGEGAHACNSSTLGGQGVGGSRDQEFKTSLAKIVKPHLYQKTQKLAGCATQEAEAENCLNPGGRDCSEQRLHSSLGNIVRLCLKEKEMHYGHFTILKVEMQEIHWEGCLFRIAYESDVTICFDGVIWSGGCGRGSQQLLIPISEWKGGVAGRLCRWEGGRVVSVSCQNITDGAVTLVAPERQAMGCRPSRAPCVRGFIPLLCLSAYPWPHLHLSDWQFLGLTPSSQFTIS